MSLPLPIFPARPTLDVHEGTDPVERARAERVAELVRELLPAMRRRAPHLDESALLAAVERIAAHRAADEELAQRSW